MHTAIVHKCPEWNSIFKIHVIISKFQLKLLGMPDQIVSLLEDVMSERRLGMSHPGDILKCTS